MPEDTQENKSSQTTPSMDDTLQSKNQGSQGGSLGNSGPSPKNPFSKNKNWWALIIFVVAIIIIAVVYAIASGSFLNLSKQSSGTPTNEVEQDSPTQQQVAAEVDGVAISMDRVNALHNQLLTSNPNLEQTEENKQLAKQQALTNLINQELIFQAAQSENITVSQEEVDQQFETIKGRFENEQAFNQTLAQNNTDVASLKTNISRELAIEKYVEANVDTGSISVSDQEIEQFYNQLASGQENAPTLEDVRGQIEAQIRQQKINQKINELINNLKQQADIQIYI